MNIINWSSLSNGTVFGGGGLNPPSFDPSVDTLHFDDPSIPAAMVASYSPDGVTSVFSYGGKTVTLDTGPYTLSSAPSLTANITFAGSGIFVYGDNINSGATPDDGANTLIGGSGDDFLAGGGGADTVFGGGGNDFLAVSGDSLTQAFGNDTLNGGADPGDFFGYIQSVAGATINLGNETANGSAAGGDDTTGGGSTLTLIGIEGVFGTDYADVINANSSTLISGRTTDIVQFIEGGGGNDVITGAAGVGRLTVLSYRFSPGGVNLGLEPGTTYNDGFGGMDTFSNIDGVLGSAFSDSMFVGASSGNSPDEIYQFFEGMAGNDNLGGGRTAYDHSPFKVVVNLSESAITGDFFGTGTIAVNTGTARDGWDSMGGGTDTLNGLIDARGSNFDDTLVGGEEDDNWFEGMGGDDYIDGGGDPNGSEDTVEYIHATDAVYVHLGSGTAYGRFGDSGIGTDTLVNIEGIRGSDFDDQLIGGGVGATIRYHVEFFQGLAGNDTLDGGDSSSASVDIAVYDNDPSAVIVNLSSVSISSANGPVEAGTARDGYGVNGNSAGIDKLVNINGAGGSRFNDTLVGGAGDNWLSGSEGADSIVGGAGSDTVIFDGPEDFGNGVIVNLGARTATDAFGDIDRLVGIENVWGTFLDDTITGDGQDNDIDGDGGDDIINGGDGIDTAFYQFPDDNGVTVNLTAARAADGMGGEDTLSNIENIVGSENDDHLVGNDVANVLEGSDGNDDIDGRGGNDTLIGGGGNDGLDGGTGNDRLVGGTGNDTYYVDSASDRVIEAAGAAGGNDTVITSVSMGLPLNVENIIFTGNASIVISGNAQNNVIGGGANDDTLSGGAGIDTVSYELATAPVVINLATNSATGQGTDVLAGFENATGGSGADVLIGNNNSNELNGSRGADTMRGGFGNDTYFVDRATDVVREDSNSTPGALMLPGESTDGAGPGFAGVSGITDTVIAAVNYSLSTAAFVENLTLSGAAARATGNALANRLTGNEGNDTLSGGGGNDTLNGGAGTDLLKGDTGNDIMVWASADSYDGGGGSDTLKVSSGNLNLTAVDNAKVRNVEQIDLTGGGFNTLTLDLQDVLAISSTTNELIIRGTAGDTVNFVGDQGTFNAVSGGLNRYSFIGGGGVLLIDADITVI